MAILWNNNGCIVLHYRVVTDVDVTVCVVGKGGQCWERVRQHFLLYVQEMSSYIGYVCTSSCVDTCPCEYVDTSVMMYTKQAIHGGHNHSIRSAFANALCWT